MLSILGFIAAVDFEKFCVIVLNKREDDKYKKYYSLFSFRTLSSTVFFTFFQGMKHPKRVAVRTQWLIGIFSCFSFSQNLPSPENGSRFAG